MDFAGPEFILAIIAISTGGWIVNNWIRARHGYALEDEWGGKTPRAEDQAMIAMRAENAQLRQQLEATHQRLANVEAIVTERGFDVASQIEALRRTPARSETASEGSPR